MTLKKANFRGFGNKRFPMLSVMVFCAERTSNLENTNNQDQINILDLQINDLGKFGGRVAPHPVSILEQVEVDELLSSVPLSDINNETLPKNQKIQIVDGVERWVEILFHNIYIKTGAFKNQDYMFLVFVKWLFNVQIGSQVERTLIKTIKLTNSTALFKTLFSNFQNMSNHIFQCRALAPLPRNNKLDTRG